MSIKERIKILERDILLLINGKANVGWVQHLEDRVKALENKAKSAGIQTNPIEAVKQQVIEHLKRFDIPDWAFGAAVDKNGQVWVYRNKKMYNNLPSLKCAFDPADAYSINIGGNIPLHNVNWRLCFWPVADLLGPRQEDTEKSTQDWENLLSINNVLKIDLGYPTSSLHKLNAIIHELIKPLLDENKDLRKKVESLTDSRRDLRKRVDVLDSLVDVSFVFDSFEDEYRFEDHYSLYHCLKDNYNIDENKIDQILIKLKKEK
jgi:hypothetical protein